MKNNKMLIFAILIANFFIIGFLAEAGQHTQIETPLKTGEIVGVYLEGKSEALVAHVPLTRYKGTILIYEDIFLYNTIFRTTPKNGAKIGEVNRNLKKWKAGIISGGGGNPFLEIGIHKQLNPSEVKLMEKEIVRKGLFTNAKVVESPLSDQCKTIRISILDFKFPVDAAPCKSGCITVGLDSCGGGGFTLSKTFSLTAKGLEFIALIKESQNLCPLLYFRGGCPE
jgi:hypothetical protein